MNQVRLVTILSWLFLANVSQAEVYRDAARHFSLKLPDGWVVGSPKLVAFVNEERRKRTPDIALPCISVFHPEKPGATQFPHILAIWQQDSFEGASYEDIEKEFDAAASDAKFQGELRQIDRSVSDVIKNRSMGTPVLDRSRNCIVVRTKMNSVPDGKVELFTVGFIGKEGILKLQCWDLESDFEKNLPNFEAVLDSFRFDPGYEFKPRQLTEKHPSAVVTKKGAGGLFWIAGLLLAGLIVAIAVGYLRKKALP